MSAADALTAPVITFDGPSGTGKGTIAGRLAANETAAIETHRSISTAQAQFLRSRGR